MCTEDNAVANMVQMKESAKTTGASSYTIKKDGHELKMNKKIFGGTLDWKVVTRNRNRECVG